MAKEIPNPGSTAALDLGCKCPVLDNHYGKGFPWPDHEGPAFWFTDGCPVHNEEYMNEKSESKPED